jgi:hypothetical protein
MLENVSRFTFVINLLDHVNDDMSDTRVDVILIQCKTNSV